MVSVGSKLPKDMVKKKLQSERAVVLREKRKKEMAGRKKEQVALEKKLRFKPAFMHVTHPTPCEAEPKPTLPRSTRQKLIIPHPQQKKKKPKAQIEKTFSQINLLDLNSNETGLTDEDIHSFITQSKLTRDMLKINLTGDKVSMVFDQSSERCEELLRKEIHRKKSGRNPTYCII